MFHGQSGTFTSPNYPDYYPMNTQCDWTIVTDPAYHVDITFAEDFDVEFNPKCVNDYVAVRIKY